jgi:hypothetical protein
MTHLDIYNTSYGQKKGQESNWQFDSRPRKVVGLPSLAILGLPLGNHGTKSHLGATPTEWCKVYYMGEGGGFPRVRAVVSFVSPKLPVTCFNTKGAVESDLTNLLVGLM